MAKSIMQTDKEYCYLCGRNASADYYGLDEHHIFFGTANRKLSEKYGLKVYLCHDRCHLNGVHKNAEIDKKLKAEAQRIAMEHYQWTEEEFIKIFGRNYI